MVSRSRKTSSLKLTTALSVLIFAIALGIGAIAQASSSPIEAPPYSPSPQEIEAAKDAPPLATDPTFVPRQAKDLGRDQAEAIVEDAFGPLLDSQAGVFNDLHVAHFLSDHLAVLPINHQPTVLMDEEALTPPSPTLIESTTPLRTESSNGSVEPVDLSLDFHENALEPVNAVTDLHIPAELGEGIELPDDQLTVSLSNVAPERAPSRLKSDVAFYPNIRKDTDLVVAPTPTGVEMLTTLRSTAAPDSQEYVFDLSDGSSLVAAPHGGAAIQKNGEPTLLIQPPVATDASGKSLPVQLNVADESITVTVDSQKAAYPIAVDPTLTEPFDWNQGNGSSWRAFVSSPSQASNAFQPPSWACRVFPGDCWKQLIAQPGYYQGGSMTTWDYPIPRLEADMATYKEPPTSWIQAFYLNSLSFYGNGNYAADPTALFAISNHLGQWQYANSYAPNQNGNWAATMGETRTGKMAGFALLTFNSTSIPVPRWLTVASSSVVLADADYPQGTLTSTGWMHQTRVPVGVDLTDTGLGVKNLTVTKDSLLPNGLPAGEWTTPSICTGGAASPCPRIWKSGTSGVPDLRYSPAVMPTGINELTVRASDPVGNNSVATVKAKIDHDLPEVTLGGSITQQATLGATRPQYKLTVQATDGSPTAAQSGVARIEIKVDNVIVLDSPTNCASDSCSATREWTAVASNLTQGSHALTVTATDRVGLSKTRQLTFKTEPDTVAPQLVAAGSLYTARDSWVARPGSYGMWGLASDSGSGVTKLKLTIDESVVNEASQACPNGGCSLNALPNLNISDYAVGEHTAKIVATDGAGNIKEVTWSFSINSDGAITPKEVGELSDAIKPGSASPSPKSAIGGFVYEPSLGTDEEDPEGVMNIVGSGSNGSLSVTPEDGSLVESLTGLPFVMAPVGVAGASSGAPIATGDALAYANIKLSTDLISRPIRNGIKQVVQYRAKSALQPFSWKIVAVDPVALSLRGDGGVNIEIDPSVPVPGVVPSKALTELPQVVATIPPASMVDATGKSIPTAWSISGNMLTLNATVGEGTTVPASAEVDLHILGSLTAWIPTNELAPEPSEIPANATAVGPSGEPYPSITKATPNESGTEITTFLPESSGKLFGVAATMQPAPGTPVGPSTIAAPVGYYGPTNPTATSSCFLGFCAGGVICGTSGPERPSVGAVVQTYSVVRCQLSGSLPPKYEYVTSHLCLQYRISLAGHAAWTYSKCNAASNPGPNWTTARTITRLCDHNVVFRGISAAGPVHGGRAVLTESVTYGNRCP